MFELSGYHSVVMVQNLLLVLKIYSLYVTCTLYTFNAGSKFWNTICICVSRIEKKVCIANVKVKFISSNYTHTYARARMHAHTHTHTRARALCVCVCV